MKEFLTQLTVYHRMLTFNPLPNDKFLDWSELKVFADDKINVT